MNCEKKILRIALFLMLILSTCTQFPSPIIADPQCAPPCWQGIIPGKTTETELLSILQIPLKSHSESGACRTVGERKHWL